MVAICCTTQIPVCRACHDFFAAANKEREKGRDARSRCNNGEYTCGCVADVLISVIVSGRIITLRFGWDARALVLVCQGIAKLRHWMVQKCWCCDREGDFTALLLPPMLVPEPQSLAAALPM